MFNILAILKGISKNCFVSDLRIFTRKISAKKRKRWRIKRAKSNASALAISSDSNIDEVNHAKVSKNSLLFIRNVEFLEVAYNIKAMSFFICWMLPLVSKTSMYTM